MSADGAVHPGGFLRHVEQAGAIALPAQGLVDPEMVHLKPAQGNLPPDAAAHPVAGVPQEQGQRDTRQGAGLLDHVSPQASRHVLRAERAGFLENLDLHVMPWFLATGFEF
jgi:hypothetical protein